MTLRREKIPRSRMRERRFIYNALNGLKITDITDTQIDQIKENTFAQGGVLVNEYDAIEQVSRLGGQTSSSGYLLGTLTATDQQYGLDSPATLVNFPTSPRANYKLEKMGINGTFLDVTASYRIRLVAEIDSSEVPILAETFAVKSATDDVSFDLGVVVPEGTTVTCTITSDKVPSTTPGLDVGLIYGRVR